MQGRKMLLHFLHSLHPCNSAIAEEQKSANAMDGVNADFAGAKICPAADNCQSLLQSGKTFNFSSRRPYALSEKPPI
ncbi:MAG: hypothetical protein CVV06_04120 [Gammaproteobacteria bacterium HGW-Gammaproteobacteria-10]|nr:MAG: hypothetical protein CVV06_04120 [Gammaproteobacteria bacterium HGW-Gammaproteobacteria-10]